MDASVGFRYQAEVPLLPKPGKHEQCEVTESENQIARPVPRIRKKKRSQRRGEGRTDAPAEIYHVGLAPTYILREQRPLNTSSTQPASFPFSRPEKVRGAIYVLLGADLTCHVSGTL